jgi:hypothetical protein
VPFVLSKGRFAQISPEGRAILQDPRGNEKSASEVTAGWRPVIAPTVTGSSASSVIVIGSIDTVVA